MTETPGLRASGVLHCNLNVRSLDAAVGLYEGLGLTVRMRSRAEGQDATPLGVGPSTDSEAWFLYDARGGRGAPAVELVEWTDPETAGDAYAYPGEVGMQALGFDVSDVASAVSTAQTRGGTVRAGGASDVDAVVLDADGVALEISAAAVDAATLRYVRIVCSDLGRSTEWYRLLGFDAEGPTSTVAWLDSGERHDVLEQRMTLGGPPPLTLRLTTWPDTPTARAHERGNDRGLFRMALAVDDVRAAVDAARGSGLVDASDAEWVPLPGTPIGGLWVSFFTDPDGVMVEYVERKLSS